LITCRIEDTATTCSDTSNIEHINAGQAFALKHTISGSPAGATGRWGIVFTADRVGESMIPNSVRDTLNDEEYFTAHGVLPFPTTSESAHQVRGMPRIVLRRLYFEAGTAAGGGITWVDTVRRNAAATALTCTISSGTGPCSGESRVAVTDGDLLSHKFDCSGFCGPADTTVGHSTLLVEVPTRRIW
jgi:hypothetical protein